MNYTVRRNVRRFNKNKRTDQQIKGKNLSLLNIPQLRDILLADKLQSQSWFDSIFLSEEIITKTKLEASYECGLNEEESFGMIADGPELTSFSDVYEFETQLPCEDLFS